MEGKMNFYAIFGIYIPSRFFEYHRWWIYLTERDMLCLFRGLTVPLIIRPSEFEDKFELVGPCYVHGLMKPEEKSSVISQGCMKRFVIV
jgi:hypothetical protein